MKSQQNNAIKGKDSVSIRDGNYTLTTSEGDGIQANNTEDATKGYIGIDGVYLRSKVVGMVSKLRQILVFNQQK